jgi:hypothetical protein
MKIISMNVFEVTKPDDFNMSSIHVVYTDTEELAIQYCDDHYAHSYHPKTIDIKVLETVKEFGS